MFKNGPQMKLIYLMNTRI